MVVPDADVVRVLQQPLLLLVRAPIAPVGEERRQVCRRAEVARDLVVPVEAHGRAGVVRVDHVAESDEDIRPAGTHGREDRKALGRVAADVLPGEVPTEGQLDRRGDVRRRRRPE